MHLGYVLHHPSRRAALKAPGGVWPYDVRPQSGHAGCSVTVLRAVAVRHVRVVGRWRPLLLPTDEADQSTAEQQQHAGGPAYVDGGAHFSLQRFSHKGVIVD